MATTQTRERPILFSGPMVRAVLDGRKTQTRRIVKGVPQGTTSLRIADHAPVGGRPSLWLEPGMRQWFGKSVAKHPPFWAGDTLWVRERWGISPTASDGLYVIHKHWTRDGEFESEESIAEVPVPPEHVAWAQRRIETAGDFVWSPSIHMPRWASRLTLEVLSVRVERVNEISDRDCEAEGCYQSEEAPYWWRAGDAIGNSRRAAFAALWDSINGKEHPWDTGPWVWVVEFKRTDAPPRAEE